MKTLERALPYIAVAVVLLLPIAGHAEAVSGDPLGGMVFWIYNTWARSIITLAFIIVGLLMLGGRHTLEGIVFAALGIGFFVAGPSIADATLAAAGNLR